MTLVSHLFLVLAFQFDFWEDFVTLKGTATVFTAISFLPHQHGRSELEARHTWILACNWSTGAIEKYRARVVPVKKRKGTGALSRPEPLWRRQGLRYPDLWHVSQAKLEQPTIHQRLINIHSSFSCCIHQPLRFQLNVKIWLRSQAQSNKLPINLSAKLFTESE
jgi:hypothetical protein